MVTQDFESLRRGLLDAVEKTVSAYFERLGHGFSMEAWREESSSRLHDVVTDAFFYGAELFPDTAESSDRSISSSTEPKAIPRMRRSA